MQKLHDYVVSKTINNLLSIHSFSKCLLPANVIFDSSVDVH